MCEGFFQDEDLTRTYADLNSRCEGLDVEDFPLFKDDLDVLPHLGTNEEVASLQTVHRAKFLLNIFDQVMARKCVWPTNIYMQFAKFAHLGTLGSLSQPVDTLRRT